MSALAVTVQAGPEYDHNADWQPKPRSAWKCTVCGRFVPSATVTGPEYSYVDGSVARHGSCSHCGREEVW